MKIHILQHEYLEDSEAIVYWASTRGHSVSCTKLYLHEHVPALSDFDWLFIMGGTMNVYEEDTYPWLKDEKQFIKQALSGNKTIVGFCLGGQLLADVLGGKVTKNENMELGWHRILLNNGAAKHPALCSLPEDITVFQWHEDTFSVLPPGAECFAVNGACNHQGFIYKDTVFALQFHFEINTKMFDLLIKEIEKRGYSGKYVQTADDISSHPEFVEQSNRLLFRFLDALENNG